MEGLWTPKEVLSFGEEGAYWRPIQECLADDTLNDEMKMFMSCKLLFDTDGMIKMLSPIPDRAPQEEIRRRITLTPASRARCWGRRYPPG